jgi:hypothetical protein
MVRVNKEFYDSVSGHANMGGVGPAHDRPRNLPGCSRHQPQQKQIVSNAVMKAYVKMRGPCLGGADDPLFEWIRLREERLARDPPVGHKKEISRYVPMLSLHHLTTKVSLQDSDEV